MKQEQQNWLLLRVIMALVGAWTLPMLGSTVGVSYRLEQLLDKPDPTLYSVVIAGGWIVNMLGLVFFGWLSDRELLKTASRNKLLVGATLALIPASFGLSGIENQIDLILTWFAYQIPASALIAVTMAIAGDKISGKKLGIAAGLIGSSPALGLLLGLGLGEVAGVNIQTLFALPAIITVVLALPLCVTYAPLQTDKHSMMVTPNHERGVSLKRLVLSVAVLSFVAATVQIYPLTFATLVLGEPETWLESQGRLMIIGAALAGVCGNLLVGFVIRSVREAYVGFVIGALIQSAGLLLLCVNDPSKLYPLAYGIAAIGIGAGLGSSVSIALFSFGRKQNIGRNLAFINGAQTLPYIVVPGIAGFFITQEPETLIQVFAWTALVSLISIPVLLVNRSAKKKLVTN